MMIRGKFRGLDVAVRLTKREAKVLDPALSQRFLVVRGRLGMVEHAWEVYSARRSWPCLVVRKGRSTASITFDLTTAPDLELDEKGQRDARLVLFKASCEAPNSAAKGRIRRWIITSRYVYARVPVTCAEVTARALRKIPLSETERSLRTSSPFKWGGRN